MISAGRRELRPAFFNEGLQKRAGRSNIGGAVYRQLKRERRWKRMYDDIDDLIFGSGDMHVSDR